MTTMPIDTGPSNLTFVLPKKDEEDFVENPILALKIAAIREQLMLFASSSQTMIVPNVLEARLQRACEIPLPMKTGDIRAEIIETRIDFILFEDTSQTQSNRRQKCLLASPILQFPPREELLSCLKESLDDFYRYFPKNEIFKTIVDRFADQKKSSKEVSEEVERSLRDLNKKLQVPSIMLAGQKLILELVLEDCARSITKNTDED